VSLVCAEVTARVQSLLALSGDQMPLAAAQQHSGGDAVCFSWQTVSAQCFIHLQLC